MRNLVIKRKNAFFHRRKAMEIYICDPQGETRIHGNPCRLLGTVDNGEIVAFPIGDETARIYVIPEGTDEDTACEFCQLPEGNADVFLSGCCQFSPFAGHPFHFDGNDSSLAVSKRRKSLLFILPALAIAVALGAFGGRILSKFAEKDRSTTPQVFHHDGMQITLTADFRQVDVTDQGFTAGFASNDTSIYVIKEAFSDEAGLENLSVDAYAQLVIDGNPKLSGNYPTQEGTLTVFEYTAVSPVDGKSYTYLVTFFKGPDAFWMIEFSTLEVQAAQMRQTYVSFANSVCFTGNTI